jgi:hypothetical protein
MFDWRNGAIMPINTFQDAAVRRVPYGLVRYFLLIFALLLVDEVKG